MTPNDLTRIGRFNPLEHNEVTEADVEHILAIAKDKNAPSGRLRRPTSSIQAVKHMEPEPTLTREQLDRLDELRKAIGSLPWRFSQKTTFGDELLDAADIGGPKAADRQWGGCHGRYLASDAKFVVELANASEPLIAMARMAIDARESQRQREQDHFEEFGRIRTVLGMGEYVPVGDSYAVESDCDQVEAKCKELARRVGGLEKAIQDAGFGVTQAAGQLSIHDVSEREKELEADDTKRILRNIELESQLATLRAERDAKGLLEAIRIRREIDPDAPPVMLPSGMIESIRAIPATGEK